MSSYLTTCLTFPYGLLGESRSHRESIHPASLAGPCWRARSPVQPRTPLTPQSQILETAFIIHHFPDLYRFCIINSCSSKWAEVFWQIALLLLHVNARAAECVEGFILCDGVRGGWGVGGVYWGGAPHLSQRKQTAIVQRLYKSLDAPWINSSGLRASATLTPGAGTSLYGKIYNIKAANWVDAPMHAW